MEPHSERNLQAKKERVLEEVSHFNFPAETLISEFQKVSYQSVEKALTDLSTELTTKYAAKEGADALISSGREDALKKFDFSIKYRGENLRNYINMTDVFHVTPEIDCVEANNEDLYSEEKDKEVEQQLTELLQKKYLCYELKNKLSEVKDLNMSVDDLIAKSQE